MSRCGVAASDIITVVSCCSGAYGLEAASAVMLRLPLQVYGEDMAILAGDALLSLSFQHIAQETRGVDASRVLQVSHPTLD